MDPIFSPPLHEQRHQFVIDFVKRNKPKKVVDLGCSECTLLKKLKFHHEIDLLVGVDIDGAKVKKKMHGLAPLSADYLLPSYNQLRVELYQGSVTQKDARLRGFDLVTNIELIEHLTYADVELFCQVVFGYMAPAAVIISTPNFEFNPLLPGLTGFRHSDHKFEWTRAEFKSWAVKVGLEHGYEVAFTGVGQAPPGQQDRVGFCSQIGVFHRLAGTEACNKWCGDDAEDVFSYTLLYRINYPSLHDNNVFQRVLVTEVLYCAEQLKERWLEEKTGESRDTSFTSCQAEGEGEEYLRVLEMEDKQTACGVEMETPVEQCDRGVSEHQKGEARPEPCKLCRCVSVPLALLWSHCPKISVMSGSLSDLRQRLIDDPKVKLSQDGSAVLLGYLEREEEEDGCLEDSGHAEASQCSHSAEPEEDWEANV